MERVNNNNRGSSNNNGGSNRSSKVSEKLLKNFNPLSSCLPPTRALCPPFAAVAVSFGFLLNAFIAALLQRPFFCICFLCFGAFFLHSFSPVVVAGCHCEKLVHFSFSCCLRHFNFIVVVIIVCCVCVWPTVLPAWQCLRKGERGERDMAKVKWLSRLFDLIYWLSAIVA